MIMMPFTPFALSSGNATATIVASTMIVKNQHFSYVVKAFANVYMIHTDTNKINNAIPKLNTGIKALASV